MTEEKRGRGRPVGFMTKEKIAQKKAFEELKETILRSQSSLLRAQLGVAKGSHIILKTKKGQKKPIPVTDKKEVMDFMERQENGMLIGEDYTIYYITLKEPDTKAIDSLIDRVHGKARQNIGIDGGEDDKPIAIKSVEEDLRNWGNTK